MRLVVSGNGPTYIVLRRTIVDTFNIADTVVAVVETITASEKIVVDDTACCLDVGATLNSLIVLRRRIARHIRIDACATHIATDIAAAIDGAYMAIHDFRPCAVVHIALLAAAVEEVDEDIWAVHLNVGAVFYIHTYGIIAVCVWGHYRSLFLSQHITLVTSAIHGANASRGKDKVRYA